MRVLFVTDWKTLGAFSVYRLIGIFGQVSIPHHVLVEQGLYLYFNLDGPRVGLIDWNRVMAKIRLATAQLAPCRLVPNPFERLGRLGRDLDSESYQLYPMF